MIKHRLFFFLYTLAWLISVPFLFLRLGLRSLRLKDYRYRIFERFALSKLENSYDLWIHAVSVGEVITAVPLIQAMQSQHPHWTVLVTTMTPTGSAQVKRILGDTVGHTYVPYDIPWVLKRFLQHYKPKLLVLMETEIWPNMIRCCIARDMPIMLANARLSKRSARKYAYLGSWRAMLFSKLWIAAQTKAHARRFAVLGSLPERIVVTSSLKYDVKIDASQWALAEQLKRYWADRPSYIAASMHTGEEAIVLESFLSLRQKWPNLLLVIAPRHPERCAFWLKQCQQRGLITQLRSTLTTLSEETAVLLVDTLGELPAFYASTDIAVVGGSFIAHGGHNILEPAMVERSIITGPSMFNFADIHQAFQKAQAILTVESSQLTDILVSLLSNKSMQLVYGQRAKQLVMAQQGAVLKQQTMLKQLLIN